jgi:hypothetical protein
MSRGWAERVDRTSSTGTSPTAAVTSQIQAAGAVHTRAARLLSLCALIAVTLED